MQAMADSGFVICLLVAAGAIALWIDARRPGLMPKGLSGLTRHLAFALLALVAVLPLGTQLVAGEGTSGARMYAALLGIVVPGLVYTMLVAVWLIKVMQQALGRGVR
jgi:uncharacterized membrane protein